MLEIKCAVVDDNVSDLEQVRSYFQDTAESNDLCYKPYYYSNPSDLDVSEKFDLYILDIDMPGKTGFMLAKEIYDVMPDAHIIFLTNYEHFVFETFKLNAFYFVRKYFMAEEMTAALKKYTRLKKTNTLCYNHCESGEITAIPYGIIHYFEVLKNDLYVHTNSHVFRERKSMKALLTEIGEDGFILISQNYLVNYHYISEVNDHFVLLKNDKTIQIPRRKEKEVLSKYMKWTMKGL